jgi:hypothetical protein
LPLCDRSAKLQAGITRLADAADRHQACVAARALLSASEVALSDNPWWRVHRAAFAVITTVCDQQIATQRTEAGSVSEVGTSDGRRTS